MEYKRIWWEKTISSSQEAESLLSRLTGICTNRCGIAITPKVTTSNSTELIRSRELFLIETVTVQTRYNSSLSGRKLQTEIYFQNHQPLPKIVKTLRDDFQQVYLSEANSEIKPVN